MKRIEFIYLLTGFCTICSCTSKANSEIKEVITEVHNTVTEAITEIVEKDIKPEDIRLDKELLYDKHTLKDTYPYKDTTRHFQWKKIKERLALLENIRKKPAQWCILQNYKNRNGEAPLVKSFKRDAYKRIADTLGVERYQGIPLFLTDDTLTAERYGLDGLLTRHLGEEGKFTKVEPVFIGGEWYAPTKYIKLIPDSVVFNKAIFIDRHNQNITTLERKERGYWLIRSMNPATTGQHRPPYAQETPLGMFVLQEKKTKMIFLKDGSACVWKNWITGAKLRTFLFQNKYNRLINRCPFENKLGNRDHRIQLYVGYHPPLTYVCKKCHLSCQVYFRMGTC